MHRIGALSIVFLLGALTLAGQISGKQPADPAVLQSSAPFQANCPIGIKVRHEVTAPLLLENGAPKGFAQKLHITLSNSKPVGIVAVRITVHGYDGSTAAQPAVYKLDSAGAMKTLDLDLKVGPRQDASTDVLVHGFTGVSFIDLDSVTYADGSSWRSANGGVCRIYPSLLL